MQELAGKSAIITGASRGIGAATAREFAKNGVKLVLAARSKDALDALASEIQTEGGIVETIACDVAKYDDLAAAVELCHSSFGCVDILVNNAGVIDPIARLDESDPDQWSQVVDINLKGVYYGIHAALPCMVKQGGGVIINISSGAATGALEGWSHYCATKAAVLSLTKCTDKEYREKGVRVIGMSPGTVATDMQVKIKASGVNPVSQLDPSVHIPADWPARAIAYLCTEDAADYCGTDFSLKTDEGRRRVGLID
ncbi:MAG: SDR family oxidoreductase [Pseudomonadota bacterium]